MKDLKLIVKRDKERYYAYKPLQRVLPRLSKVDKEDLKEDIKKHGLKEPIKVVEVAKDRYVVLDGVHRLETLKDLGWVKTYLKREIIEVKKEDWFRVGLALNVSAKKGRQMKRKDLVKKLYERYKERKTGRPSVGEFRKELETYGLHLSEDTIKSYLFDKPEHHRHSSKSAHISTGSAKSGSNLSPPAAGGSNSAQQAESTHISTILRIAALFNTNVNDLVKTLRELAPKLDSLSKRLDRSHLEVLRFCIEAVATSLTEKG